MARGKPAAGQKDNEGIKILETNANDDEPQVTGNVTQVPTRLVLRKADKVVCRINASEFNPELHEDPPKVKPVSKTTTDAVDGGTADAAKEDGETTGETAARETLGDEPTGAAGRRGRPR